MREDYQGKLPKCFTPRGPEPYPDCEVKRDEWGAVLPRETELGIDKPIPNVLLTHTDTETCLTKEECTEAVKNLQRVHMEAGLCDIRHNYLIGGDGNVYQGRGWNIKAEVSQLYPEITGKTVDVGYIGYKGNRPSEKQRYAGKSLIKDAMNWKKVSTEATFYSDL